MQEFHILETPIKLFIKSYGLTNNLLNLLCKRFECFSNYIFYEDQIIYLFDYIKNLTPINFDFKLIHLYNLLLLDYTNSYYVFRHLFNLPVNGQRTWGGGRSIRNTKSVLYNYKLKKFFKFSNYGNTIFLAEVINYLWKWQWFHEWNYSSYYISNLPWYVMKKQKFVGWTPMIMRQIESFFPHPYKFKKKKSHRKKKIINKHIITVGFDVGFSLVLKKNLFNM